MSTVPTGGSYQRQRQGPSCFTKMSYGFGMGMVVGAGSGILLGGFVGLQWVSSYGSCSRAFLRLSWRSMLTSRLGDGMRVSCKGPPRHTHPSPLLNPYPPSGMAAHHSGSGSLDFALSARSIFDVGVCVLHAHSQCEAKCDRAAWFQSGHAWPRTTQIRWQVHSAGRGNVRYLYGDRNGHQMLSMTLFSFIYFWESCRSAVVSQ